MIYAILGLICLALLAIILIRKPKLIVATERDIAAQTPLTASATSQQSAGAGAGTNMICVDTDDDIHVSVGADPVATTSHKRIAGGDFRFFQIMPGYKVAIIAA